MPDIAGVPVEELSTDGIIVSVNDAYCQMLGREPGELLGHRPTEFTHPDDRAATAESVTSVATAPHDDVRFEKRYLRADGTVVWVRVSNTWLPVEHRVVGHVVEINEDIEARDAARAAQLRLTALVEEVVAPSVDSGQVTAELDEAGFVRLSWEPGVKITGDLAREAVAALERVCGGRPRPMLVDMTSTGALTRGARVVFAEKSAASAIALLGKSAVDRVIANFALGVSPVPVPTRFFTVESVALAWLLKYGDEREP